MMIRLHSPAPTHAERDAEQERLRRLEYRVRQLPGQIARTRSKLSRLEHEAIDLGLHDLADLRLSARNGDLIAREWLGRLGVAS